MQFMPSPKAPMRLARWIALALVLPVFAAAQQSAPEKYSLKEDAAPTGSLLKRDAIRSTLPIDRSWAELTPAQQGSVRSHYVDMPAADEPPFPLKGTQDILKGIRDAAEKLFEVGTLELTVRIDEQGKPVSVQVYDTPSQKMTMVAATILMNERYKPARCGGKPCVMDFPLYIDFNFRH